MSFDNRVWFVTLVINIAAVAIVALTIVIARHVSNVRKRREINRKKREAIQQLRAEETRIAELPKLNKKWLVYNALQDKSTPEEKKQRARTFGNRYNHFLVYDEDGAPYVGLMMPETLQSLRAAEFVQCDYWIPYRGCGEAYSGDAVMVDGQRIDTYPLFMDVSLVEGYHCNDWKKWAEFERAFDHAYRSSGENYQAAFQRILGWSWLSEMRTKREQLAKLRTLAGE